MREKVRRNVRREVDGVWRKDVKRRVGVLENRGFILKLCMRRKDDEVMGNLGNGMEWIMCMGWGMVDVNNGAASTTPRVC